jgi:2-polyprenyl-3-methyl-5-hydroxy-6-metoxy-1,4-benzoquinol methylase
MTHLTEGSKVSTVDHAGFDHSSDPNFFEYYERQSASAQTLERFRSIRERALLVLTRHGRSTTGLRILDIGCGAGTQTILWAELGHDATGIDVNGPLIEIARTRAAEKGLHIHFELGTATSLPYPSGSVDVCLMPELLEHVQDWKSCVNEAVRVLRPGGLLYLSTTNWLCPRQQEFNLPFYSWYPGWLKRRYERLAVTTRPDIANYARYPAVHWFSFYKLREYLATRGLRCFDRFDIIAMTPRSSVIKALIAATRALPPLRLLGHVLTEGTLIFALTRFENSGALSEDGSIRKASTS